MKKGICALVGILFSAGVWAETATVEGMAAEVVEDIRPLVFRIPNESVRNEISECMREAVGENVYRCGNEMG